MIFYCLIQLVPSFQDFYYQFPFRPFLSFFLRIGNLLKINFIKSFFFPKSRTQFEVIINPVLIKIQNYIDFISLLCEFNYPASFLRQNTLLKFYCTCIVCVKWQHRMFFSVKPQAACLFKFVWVQKNRVSQQPPTSNRIDWLVTEPQGSPCFCLPGTTMPSCQFCIGPRDLRTQVTLPAGQLSSFCSRLLSVVLMEH